jgi:hypothetical protein
MTIRDANKTDKLKVEELIIRLYVLYNVSGKGGSSRLVDRRWCK